MHEESQQPPKKRLVGFFTKVIASLLLLTTIPLTANANIELSTIHHVYMDKLYLGAVTNTRVAETAIEKVLSDSKGRYTGYDLALGNEITYITEQVFRSNANDALVFTKIDKLASVKAITTAITIGDEPIVYLKNEAEAEAALKELKLKFVTEEDLEAVEMNQQSFQLKQVELNSETKAVEKDESKPETDVTEISFQEDVTFKEDMVRPDQILTLEEAVKMLQKGTLEEKKHVIKQGEVLGKIASDYDLNTAQLMEINEGITEESILQIGQELNTLVTKPLIHVEVEREVYIEEAVPFDREVIEDGTLPKGETQIKQAGENGKSAFTYKIIEQNGKQIKKETLKEEVIEKPVTQIVRKGTKVIPSRGSGSFTWPTNGGYVSSKMGYRWGKIHKGIDIARPSNYTIKAADHGIVVSAGWDGGYGNKVVIDHQNGYRTVYAHLKSIGVSYGQKVEKGAAIGVMGSTGDSTGIHLHFEVYKNGARQNPLNYF